MTASAQLDQRTARRTVRLWSVVLAFAAVTAFRSWQVGLPPRDPGAEFLRALVAITLVIATILAVGDSVRRVPRGARSPRCVLAGLRERWTKQRVGLVLAGLAAYHVTYFCYHQLKSWNAFRPIHDDALAAFDRWLFDAAPASVLHQALGVGVADRLLVVVYESFPTLVAVAFVAPLVLAIRIREGYVAAVQKP